MNNTIITKTSEYFKKRNIILPTISELANPHSIDVSIMKNLKNLDKNAIDPLNLFRVCLLYTSPSPRDLSTSRMPSSA